MCLVAQLCLTLCDPMDRSPPSSSVHGDSLGKNTRVGMFPTKGLNPGSFPSGSDGKEFACYVGDLGSVPGLGRSPGGKHGNPLQYSRLENPHGQRSLAGYSPWGPKESDTTEQLSTAQQRADERGCLG